MCGWFRVPGAGSIREGELLRVRVGGQDIVVGRVEGRLFAVQAECSHKGGPLDKGTLQGRVLICPWHRYEFDAFTGTLLRRTMEEQAEEWRRAADLMVYEVRVDGPDLLVLLEGLGEGEDP